MPDDMSVETLGANSEQSRYTARPEVRSLLSQTVETQLLPPERFRAKVEGTVIEIRKIGDTLAVVHKTGDHFEGTLYNSGGDSATVRLDPSSRDLAELASEWIYIGQTAQETWETPEQLLKELGYGEKTIPLLASRFRNLSNWTQLGIQTSGDEYLNKQSTLDSKKSFFASTNFWHLEVKKNSDGEDTFIFNSEDSHFVISPRPPFKTRPVKESDYGNFTVSDKAALPQSLRLRPGSTMFTIFDGSGKELVSYSGMNPVTDPTDTDELYFINTGRIYKLDLRGVTDRTTRPVLESQVEIENPQELAIDPNGNFLIIRDDKQRIIIVDKESGEQIKTIDEAKGPMLVDEQGDIIYVDIQERLREVQTNFQAIPKGGSEAASKKREEDLRAMQERFASLELKKVERQRGAEISEADVADTLRQAISRQVDEPLAQTTDPAAIEDIMDRLQGLKADPANQAYGEVVDEFIGKARDKLSGIRTAEFDNQLGEYEKSLEGVKSVGDTIGLDEEFARLLELRQKTDITDPATRRNIEQRLRTIQTQKDTIVGQYQEELRAAIDQSLPNIEQLIRETGSSQELAMFGTTVEAQQFEMMLANIRDPQARRELRDKLNAVKAEQRNGLEARGRQLEEEQRLRWAQVVEEAKEDLDSLRAQITELSEARELDRFERNPLVTAWRAKIFALPPELREIEEKKLEVILGARKKDIEHRKELGVVGDTGELKFGQVSFPFYREPPRIWRPVLLPIKGAMPDYADLAFQDEQGRVWHPDPEHRIPVIADMNHEQTARMVERYRREAEEYFKGLTREVPDYNDRWKISEYQNKKLEELAESLNIQMDNHMGITILEGEAGTGKNVLIDVLANLSNREVITIACNENTAKEDLTYEFYYDPEKGTYKLPSRLIEALKRRGVIVLFDEINTVKPGIVKMLNPLFDYRRKLVINEGGGTARSRC